MATRILFICTNNAVRSPMAEALLKTISGQTSDIESAGVIGGAAVHPFAVAVMAESGLSIADHESRSYDSVKDHSFDLIIALSKPAFDLARQTASKAHIEYWETPEPPELDSGNRDQIIEGYRTIKQELSRHIFNRFGVIKAVSE